MVTVPNCALPAIALKATVVRRANAKEIWHRQCAHNVGICLAVRILSAWVLPAPRFVPIIVRVTLSAGIILSARPFRAVEAFVGL